MLKLKKPAAAVIAHGWLGDSIICTAAATSLAADGFDVSLFIRWPQLKPLLDLDERFRTVLFGTLLSYKIKRPLLPYRFERIVYEPVVWGYQMPHTAEIRVIAGYAADPSYAITLPKHLIPTEKTSNRGKPIICVGRDLQSRSYGRNWQSLIRELETFATIEWVGLDSKLSSKEGKQQSLLPSALKIASSDMYLGVEGGLLWLAGGLGGKCMYFSEHIEFNESYRGHKNLDSILGTQPCFPHSPWHRALKRHCSNTYAIEQIRMFLAL